MELSKGQGHKTVKNLVISRIYNVAHTWPLCSVQIFVDGVNLHKVTSKTPPIFLQSYNI